MCMTEVYPDRRGIFTRGIIIKHSLSHSEEPPSRTRAHWGGMRVTG